MSVNKLNVSSGTRLSLNDRFTAIAEHRKNNRPQVRTQKRNIVQQQVNSNIASANRRLLLQLERRHLMLAAMKVKRKSLRTNTGAVLKRGTVKALRVAASGKPIKANTLTKIATMKADLIANGKRRSRSLRRANSLGPVTNRLGIRPGQGVGGAAERIAKRKIARLRMQLQSANAMPSNNNNSRNGSLRSRSRMRNSRNNLADISGQSGRTINRGRSKSRGRSQSRGNSVNRRNSQIRGGGGGRGGPNANPPSNQNVRRNRSMSRNRFQVVENQHVLPAKARLGARRPTNGISNKFRRDRSASRGRRNMGRPNAANAQNRNDAAAGGNKIRARGRSRSRTRKDQNKQRQLQKGSEKQRNARGGGIGRSRSKGRISNVRNGNDKQQQQRRGRSRRRRDGERNLGQNQQLKTPKREELDKELDQYMAATRTENDVGFLLRH